MGCGRKGWQERYETKAKTIDATKGKGETGEQEEEDGRDDESLNKRDGSRSSQGSVVRDRKLNKGESQRFYR